MEAVMNTLVFKELEVQTKDGLWYLMRIMPYRTIQNYIDGLVLTFVDITAIKEYSRLAAFVHDSYDAIIVFDAEGKITEWNTGAEKMYGLPEKKALNLNISSFVPDDEKENFFNKIEKLLTGETINVYESKRITSDKKIINIKITLTPIKDRNGLITYIAATEHDMTLQKQLEAELRLENEKLKEKIKKMSLN